MQPSLAAKQAHYSSYAYGMGTRQTSYLTETSKCQTKESDGLSYRSQLSKNICMNSYAWSNA